MQSTGKFDLFPNIDLLKYVNCKVFLIHGTHDDVVPFALAQQNLKALKNPYKHWWIRKAKHNDIRKKVGLKLLENTYEFITVVHK